MKPEFVIFDMDGLILDSEWLFMTQKANVMQKYGYTQKKEDYLKTVGTGGETLRNILVELYGEDYPMEQITRDTRAAVNRWIEENGPPVKKGIRELMEYLCSAGIPMCVATTTDSLNAKNYMQRSGLLPYLSFIIGGETVHRSKPDPEIFIKAMEHAGVTENNCIVLEDSPNGIRAAVNAGISVIAIPDMIPIPDELQSQILAEVASADQAIDLMKNM